MHFPVHLPLAERMRPRVLDEIVGQEDAIGPDSALGRILRCRGIAIPSLLLVGPPGVGKTTIARVIANSMGAHFDQISGVLDGVDGIRKSVKLAHDNRSADGKQTILLVDELHRFNKAQQDAFLPHVESGLITLIGQTTENASFRVRNALLSRLRVVQLKPIEPSLIRTVCLTALSDCERGLGDQKLSIEAPALELISNLASGDARRALNCLEWASTWVISNRGSSISRDDVIKAYGKQPAYFDMDGDYHYDTISAFIKSMRGSDPDAALYYMLSALQSGEDPLFITRRMLIFASEDASCDPRALAIAVDVDSATQRLGLPECKIPMAQAAIYLACCQKSNASYKALREMETIVEASPNLPIPMNLRNAPTSLMKSLGNSNGYIYPHDTENGFTPERYLPHELGNLRVFRPTNRGLDAKMAERLQGFDHAIANARG